jgi:hypothetical protein
MSHALLNTPVSRSTDIARPNRRIRRCLCAVALLATGLAAWPAVADEAVDAMAERRRLAAGWGSSQTEIKMTIVEAGGAATVRELRQYAVEVPNDGNRTINIFVKPRDVDGLAVLTHSHRQGNDDQWLYLPSNQRVKRIASTNRSGSFAGSEFAYEDISSFEVEKYTHSGLQKTQLDGKPVLTVTSVPAYENSGYAKLVSHLDPATYQPQKVEFYNTRGEVLKSLTLSGYKSYAATGGWRPHKLDMLNHLTGRRTVLEYGPFQPSGIAGDAFNSNRLGQVR